MKFLDRSQNVFQRNAHIHESQIEILFNPIVTKCQQPKPCDTVCDSKDILKNISDSLKFSKTKILYLDSL